MYTMLASIAATPATVAGDVWSWFIHLNDIQFIPRILVALLLGFLIGLERRSRHKSVGVRTYMVIAAASAVISMAGIMALAPGGGGDPTRLAGQILSGIGMIGAGVILKRGFNATGVTTSAFILFAVGAGIMAGFGFYAVGIISTIIVLLATILAGKHFSSKEYAPPVHVVCKDAQPDHIIALFGAHAILRGFKQLNNGVLHLDIQPMMSPAECEALLQRLLVNESIIEASQTDVD
jgi:putative Mg2+ transporter-C (MgtC) family protein